ncbi:chemotaxis protein CheD [Hylemonella gracilis str. Niagara R]|uniref:Probable chemoreceptor glutamine deamidase CheD n=1 Tax=Hylemonella gracilis str. Niagara R TaxID=1458275 RepID=A0A016XKX0_9BURK|nr:chemotaxis protein CheD [Hylemonella gracilis]EYC51868.1 chemotaxis protein CheD [Hylemonella gracilis str. Niagara R]
MSSSTHKVFLLPGDFHVGDEHFHIRTLLGSCVSITLWHPRTRIGAMSHFMLSGRSGEKRLNGRYGEDSLELLMAGLELKGVHAQECEAKVFGGGAMFTTDGSIKLKDIGRCNGLAARAMLQARHIPVVSESLFGTGYRKIMFDIKTGDVWMRHVGLSDSIMLAPRGAQEEAKSPEPDRRLAKTPS